jgi:acylphosphatase
MGKTAKKAPMSLADALSFNGEDAEKICMMADGSAVNVIKQYQLKEDGTVEIEVNGENEQAEEMRLAISVNAYSKVVKTSQKTANPATPAGSARK